MITSRTTRGVAFAMVAIVAGSTQAASIFTQTPQGTYTDNVLGGSRWTTFTGYVTAQHTYTEGADFSNLATLQGYDAVWVDQELGNTLSAAEISALTSYVSGGGRAVLIGENSSWNAWNGSLMSVVGGSFVGVCDSSVGIPLVNNVLTSGVAAVQNVCGSQIGGAGSPTQLFDNDMAALYSIGSGDVLVILDSNWNENSYLPNQENDAFAQNIVTWLGQGSGNDNGQVPAPATLALIGLGIAGIGYRRRRQIKAE